MNRRFFVLLHIHKFKMRCCHRILGYRTLYTIVLSLLCLFLLWKVITLIMSKDSSEHLSFSLKPQTEYELLRRRIRSNTLELFNFIQFTLSELKKNPSQYDSGKYIDNVISISREHKNAIISDMDRMRENDGYESWRQEKKESLSELVQRRIEYLQNPKNCSQAKKFVCRLRNIGCGFGGQIHSIVLCFILAYATERTFVIDSESWNYQTTWEKFFLPLSKTCLTYNDSSPVDWMESNNNSQLVELPYKYHCAKTSKSCDLRPLIIPKDLAFDLKLLHGQPYVWWIGQFIIYLLRLQPETQKIIYKAMKKMNFKNPIVGVHIRRTDKVASNEASFYSVDEYMQHVNDYYDQLEMTEEVDARRVYIASDEPKAIEEARTKYPNYEFLCNIDSSQIASQISTRYTSSSLLGLITDIILLSQTDYLVCGLSSNICRVAMELMHRRYPDASQRVRSLDDIYTFIILPNPLKIAVLAHHPKNKNEILMNIGDLIKINYDFVKSKTRSECNGFMKGFNLMNNQSGFFPLFKVIDHIEIAKFPEYLNIN